MQKWEYCAVVGIAKNGRNPAPHYPAIWFFTQDGCKIIEITGQENVSIAQWIAKLGEDGWEMVGVGDMAKRFNSMESEALYFKRPKP